MKRMKSISNNGLEQNSTVLYARLECCNCHETYYVRKDDPRTVLIPTFISEGEFFTSECPICEVGLYAMFVTYIESVNNKGA